jgi:steroid 5-alpha reductase family enzyme
MGLHPITFGALASVFLMTVLFWLHHSGLSKAGLVDAAWAYGVGALGVVYATRADAPSGRRMLIALIIGFWAIRLGTMLLRRILRMPEDGRYVQMIDAFGVNPAPKLFAFHMLQASWLFTFALPPYLAAENKAPWPAALDWVGCAIASIAVVGEGIADRQLTRFRDRAGNKGKVCKDGLWSWSRHPNYFFEWVFWWSFVAIGWGGPLRYWTLLGPILMFVFLNRVTGIPFAEQQALRSRGEAYREYQQTTSAFFPWPPRGRSQTAAQEQ